MKRKFYFLSMAIAVVFTTLLTTKLQAQNDVYWREGFEGFPSISSPTTIVPQYGVGDLSGEWFMSGVYRTNGTACAAPTGPFHIRWKNISGVTDSGYLATPSVDFGIQELHLLRTRAARTYSIWVRDDTSAQALTGWTLAALIKSSPTACQDTTILIASPTAKRLKIVGRPGTDSDLDSIWMTSFSAVVPIKFNGINASFANGFTKVNWNIATEINTLRYDVERSADGRNFTTVGSVKATNAGKYNFIDNSPASGDNFYRIKGIDKDGSVTLSSVIRINSNRKQPELSVLPNPVISGKLNVQLSNFERGTYTLTLLSNAGQKVYATTINNEASSSIQSLQLPSSVQPGMYKLMLVNGSTKTSKSVVVQ